MPTRVTGEGMAQQWRDGKRIQKKVGDYPSMSPSPCGFKRDFADVIGSRTPMLQNRTPKHAVHHSGPKPLSIAASLLPEERIRPCVVAGDPRKLRPC